MASTANLDYHPDDPSYVTLASVCTAIDLRIRNGWYATQDFDSLLGDIKDMVSRLSAAEDDAKDSRMEADNLRDAVSELRGELKEAHDKIDELEDQIKELENKLTN